MVTTTGRSIIIAEDDSTLLRLLVMALESSGYEVRSAENGEGAKQLWQESVPDLLLTDLQMPVLDGLRLVEWVRNEAKSEIPVMVLTSIANHDSGKKALSLGATRVVAKPVQLPQLLAAVGELLPT
ncbi:MAG: response regulator [Gammaproteobacteria bacterium]|nr:response regulator [Gammaproteobacteria bacterium]